MIDANLHVLLVLDRVAMIDVIVVLIIVDPLDIGL